MCYSDLCLSPFLSQPDPYLVSQCVNKRDPVDGVPHPASDPTTVPVCKIGGPVRAGSGSHGSIKARRAQDGLRPDLDRAVMPSRSLSAPLRSTPSPLPERSRRPCCCTHAPTLPKLLPNLDLHQQLVLGAWSRSRCPHDSHCAKEPWRADNCHKART